MKSTYAFAAVLVAVQLSIAEAQVAPSTGILNAPTILGAQSTNPGISASVPLSLKDAIQRGLRKNLGVLLQEQEVRLREGKHWQELADVLPHLSAGLFQGRQLLNPVAFGFPLDVIGPFNVFDARVFASHSLLDTANLHEARMEGARATAERHSYESVRALVVTTVANLYLQAAVTTARLGAAQARGGSGEIIRAVDSGTDAGSSQSRARLLVDRRRLVALQTTLAKQKLALAQAIGLPHGQQFTLVDQVPYAPAPPISLDDALQRAYQDRPDFQAQLARVKSAEAKLRSASSRRLPTVHLGGNYGKIGPSLSEAKMTFGIDAIVRVPILQGGLVRGKVLEADAELRQQKARLEDLRDGIYYEIQNAFLDVQQAEQEVQLARESVELAKAQQVPSRDRASVIEATPSSVPVQAVSLRATTVTASGFDETLQAPEVAAANEDYISALYAYNVAKLALARILGVDEEACIALLTGAGR